MAIYRYTVCWRDKFCRPNQWKSSEFSEKEKAKKVAKSIKTKIKPKPYIIQTIVVDGYFGLEQKVEKVYDRKIKYFEYEKKIRF